MANNVVVLVPMEMHENQVFSKMRTLQEIYADARSSSGCVQVRKFYIGSDFAVPTSVLQLKKIR